MNMDALFEKVGRTIAVTGEEAAKKAREVTENVQLRAQIGTEKGRLKELYAVLGKWYFETSQGKRAEKENHPEEELIRGIEILLARIEKLEEKLGPSEETILCPLCGAKAEKEASFCSKCGAKIKKEETPPAETMLQLEAPLKQGPSEEPMFEEP